MEQQRYVDIKFIANYLGFKESTISTWVKRGEIPFYRKGKCLRFDLVEIIEWFKTFKGKGKSNNNKP